MQLPPDLESRSDMIVEVTDWQPAGVSRCIAASSRNFVGLMEDGRTVLKYPHRKTQDAIAALHEEAELYQYLPPHDNLVSLRGVHDNGLLLEYCERGELRDVIRERVRLDDHQRRGIARQIILCLMHLHKHDFIHCDLNVTNVFVTSTMTAKIGDLQGQLYGPDGNIQLPTMSQENAKSRHPQAGEDEFSPRTDIFALGTLLYHLWREESPFPELNDHTQPEEIQARYRRGEFPIDISGAAGVDEIIAKCWNSRYKSVIEVLCDLDNLDEHWPPAKPNHLTSSVALP